MTSLMDEGKAVVIVHLDLSKAFDLLAVPCLKKPRILLAFLARAHCWPAKSSPGIRWSVLTSIYLR